MDGLRAVTTEQCEMMHFARFTGFNHKPHRGAQTLADQMVMDSGGSQQSRDRNPVRSDQPVGEHDDVVGALDRRFGALAQRPLIFYGLFAVVVTNSVQVVGVFLVFASLIIPSLGARAAARERQVAVAYAIGVGGYVLGLIASGLTDVPTGAAIVCALALVAAASAAGLSRRTAA